MEENVDFRTWRAASLVIPRANYRSLFESGAMRPVVEFLSQPSIDRGALQSLHEITSIPVPTLKTWRSDLPLTPPREPYAQPGNICKRALNPEQEEELAHRLQSEFIDENRFCPLMAIIDGSYGIRRRLRTTERLSLTKVF
jgi:hypothetical protein